MGLVELDDGTRLYGRVVGVDHDDLRDGLRLRVGDRHRRAISRSGTSRRRARDSSRERRARQQYVDEGWWDGSTLAGARARARARPARGDRGRRRDHRRARHLQPAVGRRVPGRRVPRRARRVAGRRRVGAAAQLVRDRGRRPRRARARRGAQPAAAELPGARAAPHPRHRAHEAAVHARRVPRLRPRRARSRARTSRSTRCDGHVVVRGAGDFWQHVLGRAAAHLEPLDRSRRALRGDLHVGHRGDAEGRDAHRAHHELQRALGVRGQRAHRPTTSCGCRARSATRPA